MNTAYVTHPSVRMKGTENYYHPVQCFDPLCPDKLPHMHCPFCVKTDVYTDPVILKAHYRVKHVDKGIEFGGLKVLRCCDRCDIVGVIKGEKKFKGAHWHCYRCRNGFNRRDEAVKHYNTHFRNPQTTFEIQISREVNTVNTDDQDMEQENATATISSDGVSTIHPVLSEAVTSLVSSEDQMFQQNTITSPVGKLDGLHMPVAAIETVELNDTQTIMIIQDDGVTSLSQDVEIDTSVGNIQDSPSPSTRGRDRIELEQRIQQLELENAEQQKEIDQLKSQLKEQREQLDLYRRREQELLAQLSIPLEKGIQELLMRLESDHRDLLHQQLARLKRVYLTTNSVAVEPLKLTSLPHDIMDMKADGVNHDDSDSIIEVTVGQGHMLSMKKLYDNVNNSNIDTVSSSDNNKVTVDATDSTIQDTISPSTDRDVHFVLIDPSYSDTIEDDGLQIEEDIPIENDGTPSAVLEDEDIPTPAKRRRGK